MGCGMHLMETQIFYFTRLYLEPFNHNHQLSNSAPPHSALVAAFATAFYEFAYLLSRQTKNYINTFVEGI